MTSGYCVALETSTRWSIPSSNPANPNKIPSGGREPGSTYPMLLQVVDFDQGGAGPTIGAGDDGGIGAATQY